MMMQPNYTTLLLDYGGTLDTGASHWSHVLWQGYVQAGVPVTREQFRQAYVAGERALALQPVIAPADNFLMLLRKKVRLEFQHLEQQRLWAPAPTEAEKAVTGVSDYCYAFAAAHVARSREVLQSLREAYQLIMVTNFYGNMRAVLADFGFDTLFPTIVESAVVGVRKPDPAIWQLGLDAAGVGAAQAVAVGDSVSKDVRPAASLGCATVWMQGRGWEDDKPTDEGCADAVIQRIEDLPDALRRLQQTGR